VSVVKVSAIRRSTAKRYFGAHTLSVALLAAWESTLPRKMKTVVLWCLGSVESSPG